MTYDPYAPPPRSRNVAPIIVGIIAVVVIVIVACGLGGYFLTRGNDSAGPSAPTSSPSTSSAGPSVDTGRPLVQPAGAPFSWRLPSGFVQVPTPTSQTTGTSAQYTSAAATRAGETNDFLIVDSYTLRADTGTVSQAALESEFDRLVQQAGQDPSTRQNVRYNGYLAFWYQFSFDGSRSYSYFVFKGAQEVQVRCQWADEETTIKRGCEDTLNSLTIS